MRYLIALFCLICSLNKVYCQAPDNTLGNWMQLMSIKHFKHQIRWEADFEYRCYNLFGDTQQIFFRTGVGKNLDKNSILSIGYNYLNLHMYIDTDNKIKVNEHRLYQQLVLNQKIGRFQLAHQYRFEERFLKDFFSFRMRYRLRFTYPFKSSSEQIKYLYVYLSNELFFITKGSIFDRDRVQIGTGYHLNKKLQLGLGYMVQFHPNRKELDQIILSVIYNY